MLEIPALFFSFWTELVRIAGQDPNRALKVPRFIYLNLCCSVSLWGVPQGSNSNAEGACGSHFLLSPGCRERQVSSESSTITCSLRRVHTTPNTMTNLSVSSVAVPTECLVCSELALLIHFFPCQHSIVCEGESTLIF